MTKQIGTPTQGKEMSFISHLEELRWHLIRISIAVLGLALAAFLAKHFVFDVLLLGPKSQEFPTYRLLCKFSNMIGIQDSFCFKEESFRIQSRTVAGQFSAHIWTSIWAGLIVGFPYVLYEIWKFIGPGLHETERKNARGFIFVASFLFFSGVLFGYYIVAPLSINFLGSYTVSKEVFNDIDLNSYVATVRASVLACGLIFELPIIVYFLTKVGLVTPEILKKYRKISLVVVLILSAIITPPDVASQVVVAVPIMILYQISIVISRIVIKRDLKKMRKNGK
jgi:sec-independent protein translocase protein TatC